MLKEPRKRTDKVFEDYNDYHDRGMIKWVTAYAMDELVKSISAGKAEAVKDIPILPQMSPAEIDETLAEALKKNRRLSVQLNQKDRFGRQTESIEGFFKGYCGEDEILIGEACSARTHPQCAHFAQRKMVPSGGIQTKSGLIIQNLAHRTIVVFFERKAYTQEERERFLFS